MWTIPAPQRTAMTDAVAVAAAVSLPWSTSATGILIGIWILSALLSVRRDVFLAELMTPAGGLPVLLWLCAAAGMLWADVSWAERTAGLGGFHKLLLIPLLLAHFRGSDKGMWVFAGFLISCSVLLVVSAYLALWPDLPWRGSKGAGAPVKDHIAQGAEFLLCAFGVLAVALAKLRANRTTMAIALFVLAMLFLANVIYISTARTAFVVLAVLLVLFGLRQFGWKRATGVGVGASVLAASVWFASPALRGRLESVSQEIHRYQTENLRTPSGERLDFWKRSVRFIAQAPILGHGTGTIPELFRRAAVGETDFQTRGSSNPHNQTLTVAIQLGLVGVACCGRFGLRIFCCFAATAWPPGSASPWSFRT